MSGIHFNHDGSCVIDVECPALIPDSDGSSQYVACQADVEVERSGAGLYTVPESCPCGEHGLYTETHLAALTEAAESQYDNDDPTPNEVDTSGESAGERREQSARVQRTLT